MSINTAVIQDLIDGELVYVQVVIDCSDDEERYAGTLTRLGIEREDIVDEKSPIVYTNQELPSGSVIVQYRAGKPESDTDSDEEE